MNAPLDEAIQDLLRGSGTQVDPNRSVNDVLGSLGLPSLPTLPPMPALPDMPPLPVLDLSALTKPITDLAASFGSGRTDTALGPDASAVLSQVSQVLQTGVTLGSSALEAVMALWQGMGAEAAQTTATQAAGTGAQLASQGAQISTGTAAAATSVFTGRALTAAITAKYLASLAAAGPFLGTAPGQAFVVAATAETLSEVLAVIAKTRAELTFHGANVARAGTKVPVRAAPKGLDTNTSATNTAAPASATAAAAPAAGSSAASSAGSGADSMSQTMEMLQEVATVGMGLSQAATAAQSVGSLETVAAQQFSHTDAVGAAGGGVLSGGSWGPGAGAAADAAALASARTPAALAGAVTSAAAASAAEAETASPGASPSMMPMSGAGAARAATSTTSSEALRGQLVTAQHGNDVVGPLDVASVPVVGAADAVVHPVAAHPDLTGPQPDAKAAAADPPDKALTL